MESYLNDNFEVKAKNSSEEALEQWRKLCWLVKNKKRGFRFTANLSKRFEARAIQRSNLVVYDFEARAIIQIITNISTSF